MCDSDRHKNFLHAAALIELLKSFIVQTPGESVARVGATYVGFGQILWRDKSQRSSFYPGKHFIK